MLHYIFLYNPPMTDQLETQDHHFQEFITAISNGSLQLVEDILRRTESTFVNRIETQFRQPSLYFASLVPGDEVSAELIKLLIRNGANVGYKDHNDQTILFYVIREGKERCAELLLSHGLSLDDVDIYGQTPVFYAVSQNRLQIINKYATKERVNHVDKLAGQTPIYYAARKGHLQMAQKLIQKGADITHTDTSNKNVVEYAKKAKFHEVAEFLNNEFKKVKEQSKSSNPDEERKGSTRRKDDLVRDAKQTYKLVFYSDKGQTRDLNEQQMRQLLSDRPQLAEYMKNPQLIPQQKLEMAQQECWQKVGLKILHLCSKLKGAYYFLEPVDPVKFNIMDYFDIVTQPMDLSTVKKKMQHNCYANPEQFIADMELIWNNSILYNGENHVVSGCAKELRDAFRQMLTTHGMRKYTQPNFPSHSDNIPQNGDRQRDEVFEEREESVPNQDE